MRKYLLIFATIIIAIIFFIIVLCGVQIGKIRIYSYDEVVSISKEKVTLLSALDNKNINEYNKTLKSLQTAVQTYQKTKSDYDNFVMEGKITENSIYSSIDLYDIDKLGEKIKNYAKEKNVILNMDVVQSVTSTSISSEYVMCDLNFKVSGEYISIADFIYSMEDDDTLNFEIKEFSLKEEDDVLRATFSVKNIPLDSQCLEK